MKKTLKITGIFLGILGIIGGVLYLRVMKVLKSERNSKNEYEQKIRLAIDEAIKKVAAEDAILGKALYTQDIEITLKIMSGIPNSSIVDDMKTSFPNMDKEELFNLAIGGMVDDFSTAEYRESITDAVEERYGMKIGDLDREGPVFQSLLDFYVEQSKRRQYKVYRKAFEKYKWDE